MAQPGAPAAQPTNPAQPPANPSNTQASNDGTEDGSSLAEVAPDVICAITKLAIDAGMDPGIRTITIDIDPDSGDAKVNSTSVTGATGEYAIPGDAIGEAMGLEAQSDGDDPANMAPADAKIPS